MGNLIQLHTFACVLLSFVPTNGLLDTSELQYNFNAPHGYNNHGVEFVRDGWTDLTNDILVDEGPNEYIEPIDFWQRDELHFSQDPQYQDLPRLRPRQLDVWKNRDGDLDYVSSSKSWKQTEYFSVHRKPSRKEPSIFQHTSTKVSIASWNGRIRYGSGHESPFMQRRYSNLLSRFNDPGVPFWYNSFPEKHFRLNKNNGILEAPSRVDKYSSGLEVPFRVDKNSSGLEVPSRVNRNSSVSEVPSNVTKNYGVPRDFSKRNMNLQASVLLSEFVNKTAIDMIAKEAQDIKIKRPKRQHVATIVFCLACTLDLILLVHVCRKKSTSVNKDVNSFEAKWEVNRILRGSGDSHSIVIPGLIAYNRRRKRIFQI